MEDLPLINIITRFSRTTSDLQVVLNSIREQSYKNVRHIICCETEEKLEEVKQLELLNNTLVIQVPKIPIVEGLVMINQHHDYYTDYLNFDYKKNNCNFLFDSTQDEIEDCSPRVKYDSIKFEKNGRWCMTLGETFPIASRHFPPNTYFNYTYQHVDGGWVYYIDDGDKFEDSEALMDLSKQIIEHDEDTLHVFKLMTRGRHHTIPRERIFRDYLSIGHPLMFGELCGSCICFHSKYKNKSLWDEWRYGDYRFAKQLEKLVKRINFFDRIILHTP
jgi:hypothetical protein